METSADLTTLQARAEHFLQGFLHGYPAEQIPQRIASLAAGPKDNPVRELFRAADDATPPRNAPAVPPPTQPSHAHRSKFSLRFVRNKDKDRPAKAEPSLSREQRCQHEFEHSFDIGVKFPSDEGGAIDNADRLAPKQSRSVFSAKGKASGSNVCSGPTYNCVFCHLDYTTKGTCKRHIEEIHVAKRYFRCNACNDRYATAPEARKHSITCPAGTLDYSTVVPGNRKVYASEFVASRLFHTQQAYLNHLLELSALPKEERPTRSWHLKLRNLLEQPECDVPLQRLSSRLFGSAGAWRNVRWEHERVRRAVEQLEYGLPAEHGSEADESAQRRRVEIFLQDLFKDRAISTTISVHSPPPSSAAEPVSKKESEVQAAERLNQGQHAATSTPENIGKRPLSFESAAAAPQRHPPGPPDMAASGHHPLPAPHMPPQIHFPAVPETHAFSPHTTGFETQQIDAPMMFWPSIDQQQPPPYGTSFGQPAFVPQQYTNATLPDQSFGAGFENGFLPFADLTVASTVATPSSYMSPAADVFGFQASPAQQQYSQLQQPQLNAEARMMSYSPVGFPPGANGFHASGGAGYGVLHSGGSGHVQNDGFHHAH